MCLIAWRWAPNSDTPLFWAANRDEFSHRASATLHAWEHAGETVFSGLDLALDPQNGLQGTWSGITLSGRFAWLTNIRSPKDKRATAPSRGHIVSQFLCSSISPKDYLKDLIEKASRYNGFNLVLGNLSTRLGGPECWHFNSRVHSLENLPKPLKAGIYGLSNANLDTPWPKTLALVQALALQASEIPENLGPLARHRFAMYDALQNRQIYDFPQLPSTGLTLDLEQTLSAAFIATSVRGESYGTRASALGYIHHSELYLEENTFSPEGHLTGNQIIQTALKI